MPDPSIAAYTAQLLRLARYDLETMEILWSAHTGYEGIFGFHAQQAVEKALKAWLNFAGAQYPPTHALPALFALLADRTMHDLTHWRPLERLTTFAVHYRYEEMLDAEAVLDRPGIIAEVRAFIEHVEGIV